MTRNAPRSEIILILSDQSTDCLLNLRECFFEELRQKDLAHAGDVLVSRRYTSRGKPLPVKLAEDAYVLLHCLKNSLPVPRSVIKNGKRDGTYLESSRTATHSQTQPPQESTSSIPSVVTHEPHATCTDRVALSSIMREMNSLKEMVRALRLEVTSIHNNIQNTRAPCTCHVHVFCKTVYSAPDLPLLLGCPVIHASRIGSGYSWKVKIHRHSLYDALHSSSDTHSVRVWSNKGSKKPSNNTTETSTNVTDHNSVSIVTWNCRGLHNAKPYIADLIESEVDIIILQEHWLWPFELSTLGSIHPQYDFTAISDKRLHASSDLTRGCGGVAILWNKALTCIPISVLDSDRVCGVRLLLPSVKGQAQHYLTILGVYMPSADQPQEVYTSYLETVEHAVSQFSNDGPLVLMGDLNAHLGSREHDSLQQTCNSRGQQWLNLSESLSMHNISLCSLSSGPPYTYSSGSHTSTIDYVLGNDEALKGVSSCNTLEGHPLNTSDHLPIRCTFDLSHVRHPSSPAFPIRHLDWYQAKKTGSVTQYARFCNEIVTPLLEKDYSSIEEVNDDIKAVCKKVTDAANNLIQRKKGTKNSRVKDPTLSHLCWKSRCAFRRWKEAGRPTCGSEWELRKKCKKEVKSYLNQCKAREERIHIQRRDKMFQQNHPNRFRNQHHQKTACNKLFSQDSLITDTNSLLKCWADHFSSLGQSQCSSNDFLRESQLLINDLASDSLNSCDNILYSEIDDEEVEFAINRLKRNRAGGADNVSPEHLKFSGTVFRKWLCHIYNCICQLERIPQCFKDGLIVPVFKGKGKDPLLTKNHRGITLTSVFAKVFEIILSYRITPLLEAAGVPQATQTAYREGVSCTDSMFASMEALAHFKSNGDNVYSCFYDLASAFDTVEFCVLLQNLFQAGIRGKCWRLLHDWYSNLSSQVRLGNHLSESFPICRGIRQGSVLSPMLFNLVMDPLLSTMSSRSLGISINGLFLGAFAHADDLRTMASNIEDTTAQATLVNDFTRSRGLRLCPEKCALVTTNTNLQSSSLKIDNETSLPIEKSVKCLGISWDTSSSSKSCVKERIRKARAAFFANGQLGAFHGLLNPLSSRSIIESCIIPVLLYGSENWVLNHSLLEALNSFQVELGRRALKLPKFTSNLIPLLVLNWPTMCARLLCNKLSFLSRVCNGESTSLSTQVFRSIAASDVASMNIVKQCYFLDSVMGSEFTDEVLNNPNLCLRDLKERIIHADRIMIEEESKEHPSLLYILRVAKENLWPKFWDVALEYGCDGSKSSMALLKALTLTVFSDRKCPVSNCTYIVRPPGLPTL